MAMPDSQQYIWNINLIGKVEDYIASFFRLEKLFNTDNFYIFSYKQKQSQMNCGDLIYINTWTEPF